MSHIASWLIPTLLKTSTGREVGGAYVGGGARSQCQAGGLGVDQWTWPSPGPGGGVEDSHLQ